MIHECVFTIRFKELCQLLALRCAKARTHTDVLQLALVIEETEQQRSNQTPVTLFVPAKPGDNAVAIAFMLYLEHKTFVRNIGSFNRLGHHTIKAGAFKAAKPVCGDLAIAGGGGQVKDRKSTRLNSS